MRTAAATALAATAVVALLAGCSSGSGSDRGSGGGSDVTVSLKKALTSDQAATQACKTLLGVHDAKSAQKVSDKIATPRKGTAKVTGITGKVADLKPTFLVCQMPPRDAVKFAGTTVDFGTPKALAKAGLRQPTKNGSGLAAWTDSKDLYSQVGYTLQPSAKKVLQDAVSMLRP